MRTLDRRFFFAVLRAVITGDVLNAMGYRMRPYDGVPGATEAALARCKTLLHDALATRLFLTLYCHPVSRIEERCRITASRLFAAAVIKASSPDAYGTTNTGYFAAEKSSVEVVWAGPRAWFRPWNWSQLQR